MTAAGIATRATATGAKPPVFILRPAICISPGIPARMTMNETILITAEMQENVAERICIGRLPASREAFSSFS